MYINKWIFEYYVSKIDNMYIYVCMCMYVCMYVYKCPCVVYKCIYWCRYRNLSDCVCMYVWRDMTCTVCTVWQVAGSYALSYCKGRVPYPGSGMKIYPSVQEEGDCASMALAGSEVKSALSILQQGHTDRQRQVNDTGTHRQTAHAKGPSPSPSTKRQENRHMFMYFYMNVCMYVYININRNGKWMNINKWKICEKDWFYGHFCMYVGMAIGTAYVCKYACMYVCMYICI